jgi:hypothetical protein
MLRLLRYAVIPGLLLMPGGCDDTDGPAVQRPGVDGGDGAADGQPDGDNVDGGDGAGDSRDGPGDGDGPGADAPLPDAPAAPLLINGCDRFVDRTAPSASRNLTWDHGIEHDPSRCLQIRVGQTVTWTGDFNEHPLGPYGGTLPSPIAGLSQGNASYQTSFDTPGTYGYLCGDHPEMVGAIHVQP